MRVLIDTLPEQRSLTVQERKVWELLIQGKSLEEMSRILHIPVGAYTAYDIHGLPYPTLKNIICSIHEKGWDEKNKEETNMAKLTEQNKRDIITKRNCGASLPALAREYKVSPQAISDVCKKYDKLGESMFGNETTNDTVDDTKNEPATVGTVTSSETEIVEEHISETIVTPSEENVKTDVQTDSTPAALSPVIPDSVLEACRERKANLLSDIRGWEQSIADWKAQVKELDDFMEVARLCNPMGGGKV